MRVYDMRRMALALLLACALRTVSAQDLRFANHREVVVPPYDLLRIGPFYSNLGFSQSFGYRWTQSSGAGTDFLYAQRRGIIRKDGSDFPLVTTLRSRNYLIVTRHMDVDASVSVSYEHYPLGTQDNAFRLDMADEGVFATLSTSFQPTPFIRGTAYDRFVHRTDYVDTRGIEDIHGGERRKYSRNVLGLDMDWLMARDRNLAFSVAREDAWAHNEAYKDSERSVWRESLAYEQQINPFWVGGAKAEFLQTDYKARHRSDFTSQQYTVFSRLRLFRRTSMSGWAGYGSTRVSQSDGSRERDTDGFIGGGTVTFEGEVWKGLTHGFECSRTLREGYRSAYETTDRAEYRIDWRRETLAAGFLIGYEAVEPSRADVNGFENLIGELRMSYPLVRSVRLHAATGYMVRYNHSTREAGTEDESWLYDYETWWGRIGTGMAVTKKTQFDTAYHRIERTSRAETLQYRRDVFSATLTYRHEF